MTAKNMDRKGRWRNVTVSFRVSPAESEELNRAVELSGMSKQDYIINKLSNKDVVVTGNPRVFQALKKNMIGIQYELERIVNVCDVSEDMLDRIREVIVLCLKMNDIR